MKTRMKKLLAGMCAVLILPIGSAQTVLAEEPEQCGQIYACRRNRFRSAETCQN